MMKIAGGGWADGWAVGQASVNVLFWSIRNILMVLGRIIEQVTANGTYKNDNSACPPFLMMSPDSYLYLISGLYLSNHLKYFNDTL